MVCGLRKTLWRAKFAAPVSARIWILQIAVKILADDIANMAVAPWQPRQSENEAYLLFGLDPLGDGNDGRTGAVFECQETLGHKIKSSHGEFVAESSLCGRCEKVDQIGRVKICVETTTRASLVRQTRRNPRERFRD